MTREERAKTRYHRNWMERRRLEWDCVTCWMPKTVTASIDAIAVERGATRSDIVRELVLEALGQA